ncbi:MAG: hypothetical protein R3Y59_03370 [bacterium]
MLQKKLLIILCIILNATLSPAENYNNWKKHTVVGVYEKVQLDRGTMDESGKEIDFILVPTSLNYGTYEIELGNKLGYSNTYQINNTKIYIKFQINPFLYRWDKGVFKWNGKYSSYFYEEP